MKVIHFLLALSLSLGPTMQAQSQQPAQKPKQTVPKPKKTASTPMQTTPISLQSPFDPSLAKLPPKFQGHDAEELFAAIGARKRAVAKGEFESSEAYSKRIEALQIAPLFGNIRPDSTLAFVLAVNPKYNADAATFLLAREPSHIGGIPKYNYSKGDVATSLKLNKMKDHEKEVRQNAFGATVVVEVTDYLQFLGIMQPKEGVFGKAGAAITIPFSPEQAPSVKPDLALLLVCRLASLDTLNGLYNPGGEATIKRPEEITILQEFLYIDPLEIWAINRQTGEVYGKLKSEN